MKDESPVEKRVFQQLISNSVANIGDDRITQFIAIGLHYRGQIHFRVPRRILLFPHPEDVAIAASHEPLNPVCPVTKTFFPL
jgi:hypothetical protein